MLELPLVLMALSVILWLVACCAVGLDERNIGPALALNLLALACSTLAIVVLLIWFTVEVIT